MMKRLGSVLGMGLAALALILPGLMFDGAGAAAGGDPTGGVQETLVRYGPFVLPPAGQGGDIERANIVLPNVPKPCEDCFITRAEPDLVYEDGKPANLDTGLMLHHAVLFNTGRPDTTCGQDTFFGRMGERFLASGNERTIKELPAGYGYRLGREPVTGSFQIMNHAAEPKTVFVTFKIKWLPGSTQGIRPVTPVWLDVNNCRTSEYAVPAGPSTVHWTWPSTITGRIVATGGHVHTGGVKIVASNQTTGQRICTSWAGYGTKAAYMGAIESMSYCSWDSLGVVKAGDTLDIESVYDSSEAQPNAMGIMVMHVWQTDDLTSGSPAPAEANGGVAPASAGKPPSGGSHHGSQGSQGGRSGPRSAKLQEAAAGASNPASFPAPAYDAGRVSPREEWAGASRFDRFPADGPALQQSRRCRASVVVRPGAGRVGRGNVR